MMATAPARQQILLRGKGRAGSGAGCLRQSHCRSRRSCIDAEVRRMAYRRRGTRPSRLVGLRREDRHARQCPPYQDLTFVGLIGLETRRAPRAARYQGLPRRRHPRVRLPTTR
jgi:hypothetical protein